MTELEALLEYLSPLHTLIILGVVAFAATRGLRSFPFYLASMYAAFFYLSDVIYELKIYEEYQMNIGFIFTAMLCWLCDGEKRRPYVDQFSWLMIFAMINYILLFAFYISLSGYVYEDLYRPAYMGIRVVLMIADIIILVGVVNGSGRSRTCAEFCNFIGYGLYSAYFYLQTAKAGQRQARQAQTPKGITVNGNA